MEVKFSKSTREGKKMMAVFYKDGKKLKTVHFGAIGYEDFTTHKDEERKARYIKRHQKENWNDYMSAGSLARWILWNKPTVKEAISSYKTRFSMI